MANFGARLAYPTPDWVAYRVEENHAPTRGPRPPARPLLATIASALRRFALAWVKSQAHNSFL
jgi:hypothetical protein